MYIDKSGVKRKLQQDMMRQLVTASEEQSNAAEQLNLQAEELSALIGGFKLSKNT